MTTISTTNSTTQLNNALVLHPEQSLTKTLDKDCFAGLVNNIRTVGAEANHNIKGAIASTSEFKERALATANTAVQATRAGGAFINHMLIFTLTALSKLKQSLAPDVSNVAQAIANLVRKAGNGLNEIAKEGKNQIESLRDAIRNALRKPR